MLGDLVDILDGPHATPKKTGNGAVFLSISNLLDGRLDLTSVEHLSEEDYGAWTRRVRPVPGDIVFSFETRFGEAGMIPSGFRCGLGCLMGLLRVRSSLVDANFLLYAFLGLAFQETLRSRIVHGSTVDPILLTELGEYPIEILPLPEQRAIARILAACPRNTNPQRNALH